MNKNILEIKDHNSALSEIVDARRLAINVQLNPGKKSALGQFMTPRPVAQFMASLFNGQMEGNLRLLDAGAGVGSLTAAFVEEFLYRENNVERIEVTAYESDPRP